LNSTYSTRKIEITDEKLHINFILSDVSP